MQTLKIVWPLIAFGIFVIFTLGGYAVMIKFMASKLTTLFYKQEETDRRVGKIETNHAVIEERTANIARMGEEQGKHLEDLIK